MTSSIVSWGRSDRLLEPGIVNEIRASAFLYFPLWPIVWYLNKYIDYVSITKTPINQVQCFLPVIDMMTLVDIGKCQNSGRFCAQHWMQLQACILSIIVELSIYNQHVHTTRNCACYIYYLCVDINHNYGRNMEISTFCAGKVDKAVTWSLFVLSGRDQTEGDR